MVFAGLLGDIARKTMSKPAAPKLQAAVPKAEPEAAEATGASEAEPNTAPAPKE